MLSQAITRFNKFNEKLSCPVLTPIKTSSKEEGEPYFYAEKQRATQVTQRRCFARED